MGRVVLWYIFFVLQSYSDGYLLKETCMYQQILFNYSLRNISIYKEESHPTFWWIPWTFASTIAIYGTPTSNCDTPPSTSGERGYTVIDVHFVINNSWISFSVGALRTQKQLICSIYNRTCRCRAWFVRRYFWINMQ